MESAVGADLVRGTWAAMAIAVIIVILRVYAKLKIHQFRADDVLMIISMVLSSVFASDEVFYFAQVVLMKFLSRSWLSSARFS